MDHGSLTLDVRPERWAVCRLSAEEDIPAWATAGAVWSVTRRDDELSVVVDQTVVPADVTAERDWAGLVVRGPLDFSLTGILARLATGLAEAAVPIFALSTHDTDLVLVPSRLLPTAVAALRADGHEVHEA